ncbi:hypothetical protein [Paenibacillus herberti]|uniref:Uncharacterized protein n=1 Tax=Paenibacillus herberti TaxID=1619309 RepID=A0A229P688_9BACL|nr:hypothetical protein [Paenibacillus herberti]OXM17349.1 hypothetical protein CGZ75_12315 [Paenibacillus herberti]
MNPNDMNPFDEIAASGEGVEPLAPARRILELANMVSNLVGYVHLKQCSPLEKQLVAASFSVLLLQLEEGAETNA